MADISNKKLVLAGFHADNIYKIFDIDGDFHAVELTPYETKEYWTKYINLPNQKQFNMPLENPKKIKITDIKRFETTLKSIEHFVYEIESLCPCCDKRSRTAWGFKINNTFYVWSDLLFHMIQEHQIYISCEFATGIFKKLNPWCSICNFKSFKYYLKFEAPKNSSLIATHYNEFTDGVTKIKSSIIIHSLENVRQGNSFIYPLNPAPKFIDYKGDCIYGHENNHNYLYISINQQPATPENPQIVSFCDECIGTIMNNYGIDQDVNNIKHFACMWDGTRFIGPNKDSSRRLCGQIN